MICGQEERWISGRAPGLPACRAEGNLQGLKHPQTVPRLPPGSLGPVHRLRREKCAVRAFSHYPRHPNGGSTLSRSAEMGTSGPRPSMVIAVQGTTLALCAD